MPYRAVIIGAGAIGSRLDAPEGSACGTRLTHAGGYRAHPAFTLEAIADADETSGRMESARWGTPFFGDPARMLADVQPDVVSICAPTAKHEELAALAIKSSARAIVCEKPLGPDLASSRRIASMAEAWGGVFLVNYTRRFVPFYASLARRIRDGEELVQNVTVKYAKGVSHNGSHALDLSRFLFGEPLEVLALGRTSDFWEADPTVSAFMRFERCPQFFLQGQDERAFTFFEYDIVTREARYQVNEDGFTLNRYGIRHSPHYRCDSLGISGREDTGHGQAILNLLDHLRELLEANGRDAPPPRCGVRDALRAQEIAHELATQTPTGGRA
ncbi:Gfo/Idh/MocA family oxidoreductase [Nitratidesulfovibrio sp. HK-II]|jgi:predicted dehydrogenase|uniref:Gfo/Idh/MocA family protein n=1 Tax=Nitratidesulfovibrio sp. HK-II TaxID=2009266 RepID=UPI000E2FB056|nr:Gfo/Idh/MocA family oxidoreductase [Nitratidesulfovibrio sp. HK-II]GBO97688.1 dehydrogenase [Nitratidesulfovibrio sp. HK-II]